MKTKMLIVAIATFMVGFTSCNKDKNEPALNNNEPTLTGLDATKTSNIKKGEPVNFTFSQAPSLSAVQWTVVPFNDVQIISSGNTASILFGNAGSYTVNASYSQFKGSTSVSVQDSIYNPGSGGTPTYEPLTGDEIFITVSSTDSMGISGLIFRYITEKKYQCLNHTLLFDNNYSEQNLQVVFKSVMIPSADFCTSGEDYASGGTVWFPIAVGNHGFEVVLDGKTYSGSLVNSGSTYTFTWPYSSGVTITPLVIN
ncbi:MAG: hypothetical protein WCK84_13880 [Bacteroidota bacterium]